MSKKFAVIAAALALVLCASVGAAAVGGHFVDIKNMFGTVTGQKYVDATDDISLKVLSSDKGGLLVQPIVNKPNEAPYSSIDKLSLGKYTVTDEKGNVVAEGDGSKAVEVEQEDGTLAYYITVRDADGNVIESESGMYTVSFEYFIGDSKADQALEIFGDWGVQVQYTFTDNAEEYDYVLNGNGVAVTVVGSDAEPDPNQDISNSEGSVDTAPMPEAE